jgi:hypothetical protein
MGRSHTTLSRELQRNTGRLGFRKQQAQHLAEHRHQEEQPKAVKLTETVSAYIQGKLQAWWTQEKIRGRLWWCGPSRSARKPAVGLCSRINTRGPALSWLTPQSKVLSAMLWREGLSWNYPRSSGACGSFCRGAPHDFGRTSGKPLLFKQIVIIHRTLIFHCPF